MFHGLHRHDELLLSPKQRELFGKQSPAELFPEYYLIKVNNFDDVARTPLDEWIFFLKNEEIKDSFTARGLKEAKQRLDIMKLSAVERRAYERYADELHYQASMVESTYGVPFRDGLQKGREEGREEGKALGEANERRKQAFKMLAQGLSAKVIQEITGLSLEEIQALTPGKPPTGFEERPAPYVPKKRKKAGHRS